MVNDMLLIAEYLLTSGGAMSYGFPVAQIV
jgi:hypothetical protein